MYVHAKGGKFSMNATFGTNGVMEVFVNVRMSRVPHVAVIITRSICVSVCLCVCVLYK